MPCTIRESFADANLAENFGQNCKKDLFCLDEKWAFLNHGAFGMVLKDSLQTAQEFQHYVDRQPLRALEREVCGYMSHVLRQMAKFVHALEEQCDCTVLIPEIRLTKAKVDGDLHPVTDMQKVLQCLLCCDARDLVLVNNASEGINTVLRSLKLDSNNAILTLNIGYGAVEKAVSYVCKMSGARQLIAPVSLPIRGPQQIINVLMEALYTEMVTLVVIDHIPSSAAFIMPIKELVNLCNQRGVMVLVDGAHSLGQVDLHLNELNADFYVANCHKWFCNTRGSAILHVRRDRQHLISPLTVSWGGDKGFSAIFMWSGTQYYSQYISLLTTLNFWNTAGADLIRDRCSNLVKKVDRMLCEAWEVEQFAPHDMIGMMITVELPAALNDDQWQLTNQIMQKLDIVCDYLYFYYKVEIPVRKMYNKLYVRVSCHVYNTEKDYIRLRDAILEMCDNRAVLEENLIRDGFAFPYYRDCNNNKMTL